MTKHENTTSDRSPESMSMPLEVMLALTRSAEEHSCSIIITDHRRADHPIVYVNPAFEQVTGYRREEVVGQEMAFLSGDAEQSGITEICQAVREGKSCSTRIRDFKKDGTPFWTEVHIDPVHSQTGQVTHYFGCFHDISEQVAKEEYEEALLASVVHDLKTPLAAAQQMFALVLSGDFGKIDSPLDKIIRLLSKDNEKALTLVQNVLEHYRHEQGRDLLHFEEIDLIPLIAETILGLKPFIDARQLAVKLPGSERSCNAWVDSLGMTRLLVNLIDNAIKFTPHGGSIEADCRLEGSQVILQVHNSDSILSPKELVEIFGKFKRGETNNRFAPGCGLGLSVCKKVAEAHGGQISAESQVGKGTTFTVVFPREQPSL